MTGVGVIVDVTVKVGDAVYVSVMVGVSVIVQLSVIVGVIECVGVIVAVSVIDQVGDIVKVSVGELLDVTGVVTISDEPLNPESRTPLSRAASPTSDMTKLMMFPVEPGATAALVVKSTVDPLYCIPSMGDFTTLAGKKSGPFIVMGAPVPS